MSIEYWGYASLVNVQHLRALTEQRYIRRNLRMVLSSQQRTATLQNEKTLETLRVQT